MRGQLRGVTTRLGPDAIPQRRIVGLLEAGEATVGVVVGAQAEGRGVANAVAALEAPAQLACTVHPTQCHRVGPVALGTPLECAPLGPRLAIRRGRVVRGRCPLLVDRHGGRA